MREPLRSRLFIVAGVVLGALGAALITSRITPLAWAWYAFVAVLWAGLIFAHAYLQRSVRFRPASLPLTPQGYVIHPVIPWDALAPGGTMRPSIRDTWLALRVARPELVTQRGLALIAGSKERPRIPLDIRVHPHLLADAIGWYSRHPEHRAAIGTEAEHARLLSSWDVRRGLAAPGAGPVGADGRTTG